MNEALKPFKEGEELEVMLMSDNKEKWYRATFDCMILSTPFVKIKMEVLGEVVIPISHKRIRRLEGKQ